MPPCKASKQTEERSGIQNSNSNQLSEHEIVNFEMNPNPASLVVLIRFDHSFSGDLILSDLNGRVILRQAVTEKTVLSSINTALLSNGIYFIRALSNEGEFSASQKLIINR